MMARRFRGTAKSEQNKAIDKKDHAVRKDPDIRGANKGTRDRG